MELTYTFTGVRIWRSLGVYVQNTYARLSCTPGRLPMACAPVAYDARGVNFATHNHMYRMQTLWT
jgi:hypothetical protein